MNSSLPNEYTKKTDFTGMIARLIYSKTCLKRPLKNRQNTDLNDKL